MQLGFVIDQSRCIGCHACTVACKSENLVPLGSFRTWVKYTEQGAFPEVRRSFAVLRCNQCTDAPCVTICPVRALHKRADGIVDIDPGACIGCKACLQGCPYDALYINADRGVAEKCHFCAHRTELGLAPACAVVCPTEAIIPGDFHDPASAVSRMKEAGGLTARKVEAGTGPNVHYRSAAPAALDPLRTNGAGGYLWAERGNGDRLDAELFESMERRAEARTVYDVAHPPAWGGKVSGYLFTKSLAAGILPAGLPLLGSPAPGSAGGGSTGALLAALSLLFLALTAGLLVADLKRPARFLYVLTRPNWRSWLARGSFVLTGYGMLLGAWFLAEVLRVPLPGAVRWSVAAATVAAGALSAAYTGWLFAQARGRPLWMRRLLWLHLIVQAGVAGSAFLLLVGPLAPLPAGSTGTLRTILVGCLALHLILTLLETFLAPAGRREEFHRHAALVWKGPFARLHWWVGVGLGILVPLVLLALSGGATVLLMTSAFALAGLFVEEDILVRAGQALPIS